MIIINNVATELPGTKDVVSRIRASFDPARFTVAVAENLDYGDMLKFLTELGSVNFEDYKLILLLILSHGYSDGTQRIVTTEKDPQKSFCIEADIIKKLTDNVVF